MQAALAMAGPESAAEWAQPPPGSAGVQDQFGRLPTAGWRTGRIG